MRAMRGFTLIEMLVALSIFAVLGVMSVAVVSMAINARAQTERIATSISELETLRSTLRADFFQVASRPYKGARSSGHLPPMLGGRQAENLVFLDDEDGEILVTFVRRGWSNPDFAQKRPSLQHVTYLRREDTLIRRIRPFIDAAIDTPFHDQVLMEGVTDIGFMFYRPNGTWVDEWRGGDNAVELKAIRLELTHPQLGPLEQDFLIGVPQ